MTCAGCFVPSSRLQRSRPLNRYGVKPRPKLPGLHADLGPFGGINCHYTSMGACRLLAQGRSALLFDAKAEVAALTAVARIAPDECPFRATIWVNSAATRTRAPELLLSGLARCVRPGSRRRPGTGARSIVRAIRGAMRGASRTKRSRPACYRDRRKHLMHPVSSR